MNNRFVKDQKGFTGLEAAIVLIAFVVVAAVFSYVMLGAGFFTTQKSQEVVHTGVTQASSSVELAGDVIAVADSAVTPNEIKTITLTLQQTSGGSSVDMGNTLIVVSAPNVKATELTLAGSAAAAGTPDADSFAITKTYNDNGDNLIDKGEKFDIQIDLAAVANTVDIDENDEFQVEIKPPQGATCTIHRKAPPVIKAVMTLY
jgi:flagellin FlaB